MHSKKWLIVVACSLLSIGLIVLPAAAAEDSAIAAPSTTWWGDAIDALADAAEHLVAALSQLTGGDAGDTDRAADDASDADPQQFGGAVIPNG